MNDSKNMDGAAIEVADEILGEVNGGYDKYHDSSAEKYYIWNGNSRTAEKYLCPNCGRPVHYGSGWRYYCDPCNESWFFESSLRPNIAAGYWKEVSEEEYKLYQNHCGGR